MKTNFLRMFKYTLFSKVSMLTSLFSGLRCLKIKLNKSFYPVSTLSDAEAITSYIIHGSEPSEAITSYIIHGSELGDSGGYNFQDSVVAKAFLCKTNQSKNCYHRTVSNSLFSIKLAKI